MWDVLSKPKPPLMDDAEQRRALLRWYRTPLGREFSQLECQQLDLILPNLFGYYLLQLGCVHCCDWLSGSRIQRHGVVDVDSLSCCNERLVGVRSRLDELAVASDSVDVVVLPHSLEFHADPHQVLREVERVLIAEGHIVVLGFNPWSLWGAQRLLLHWLGKVPWSGRFLSPLRLKDWLSLLGFEVVYTKSYFYRPAIPKESLFNKLTFIERLGSRCWPLLGGGYVMVARKRVSTLTPIRPRWRASRRVASAEMARSSVRRKSLV